jgi:hypothetical protein
MKEKIIEITKQCAEDHGSILTYPYEDDIAERLYIFCNQEVEKRIAERMLSDEEIEKAFTTEHYHWEQGRYYKVRKDRIFGAKWFRSRLTKPGVSSSQTSEGGEG